MYYSFTKLLEYFAKHDISFDGCVPNCPKHMHYLCQKSTMHCKDGNSTICVQHGTIYQGTRRFSLQVFFVYPAGTQEGVIKSNSITYANLIRLGMQEQDFSPI